MDRESFAELIHWTWIIWVFGILNPCFMLPQLIKIWMERETRGISVFTLGLLILIQTAFALHGFFIRDALILWSNTAAALVSTAVALSMLYFRRRGR